MRTLVAVTAVSLFLMFAGQSPDVTIAVPVDNPFGVGVNPATNRVYVTNFFGSSVAVIDGAKDKAIATIRVESVPYGVGINPATNRIYVTNNGSDSVSVIDGAQNKVIATIPVRYSPGGVGVNPATNRMWCFSDYVRPKISVKMSSPGQFELGRHDHLDAACTAATRSPQCSGAR